jgi:uncharacterized protein (TIGR00255 family)
MTGYGRAATAADQTGASPRFVVELRSVNHRGFDIKVRSDRPDGFCDGEISRTVRGAVERGTVTVAVREEKTGTASLDVDRIRTTYHALDRMRAELGLPAPLDLAVVAKIAAGNGPGEIQLRGEEMWVLLRPVLEAALAELVETRSREGDVLRGDLAERVARLSEIVDQVQTAVAPVPARFTRRLEERLAALRDTPGFDQGRVAQEVALMAERLDVTEELVRLRAHLTHLGTLLDAQGSVGRKLDFVIQEIGREINTVGSKAQDATVAAQVIEGKAELEKIREQAQNIE